MAKTVNYLTEKAAQYDDLAAKTAEAVDRYNALAAQIKSAEKRMAEIAVLETHIANYARTHARSMTAIRSRATRKNILLSMRRIFCCTKRQKKAFDELGLKKLPTSKVFRRYADCYRKENGIPKLQDSQKMKRLTMAKANIDQI